MGKIVELYYNGAVSWNATIAEVHEHFRIQLPVSDWLDFADDDGMTNRIKIKERYHFNTELNLGFVEFDDEGNIVDGPTKIEDIIGEYPCPWPVQLHVDAKDITRDILLNQSNLVTVGSAYVDNLNPYRKFNDPEDGFVFSANWDSNPYTIGYDAHNQFDGYQGKFYPNITENGPDWDGQNSLKKRPGITVWIWSKALNNYEQFNKQTVFNATPFVQNLQTNTSKTGGTFQITLAPIIAGLLCKIDPNGKRVPDGSWFPDPAYYKAWRDGEVDNFLSKIPLDYMADDDLASYSEKGRGKRFQQQQYDGNVTTRSYFLDSGNITGRSGSARIRNQFFFTEVLAENDIVFISMVEDIRPLRRGVVDDYYMSTDELVNGQWTMIGLIDSNSTSYNAEATDVTINVSGRDLMKLLIEDGSYFFQKSYSNPDDKTTAFGNRDLPRQGDDANTLNIAEGKGQTAMNRLIGSGLMEAFYNQQARNVGNIMNILLSQLVNIEICPSQVFESYGDLRTKFQVEVREQVKEKGDSKQEQNEKEGE